MKKVLSLVITLVLILTVSAQDSTKKAIVDTAKVTWTRVYNDVTGALNGLGAALKVGTEHVYEILVRQQLVVAVTDLVFILLVIILCFILVKSINKLIETAKDAYDDFGHYFLCIILGIITIILVILAIVNIGPMVTGFVNPEYGAMKEIMDQIK